jgi:hypothetical protein
MSDIEAYSKVRREMDERARRAEMPKQMPEAIVTLIFPATEKEPAHTVVRRVEFESSVQMQAWYMTGLGQYSINDEELKA